MEGQKIRFGIIGYGHIGRRHAEEIQKHPDAELCLVVDTDTNVLTKAQDQHQTAAFPTLQEALDSSIDCDVYNICVPNGLHIPMAEAITARRKHVLVEKPMGLRYTDCERLIQSAAQHGSKVFCVLQNRYSPPAQFLKDLVESSRLGRVFHVAVSCYWNRDERYYTPGSWRGTVALDGGPLFTQFSHFVDLLYWLFGPLGNITGRFANYNHPGQSGLEDTGFFAYDIVSGGSGTFSYSTALWDRNMESSITIIGEKGSVKAGGQYMDKIEYFHAEGMERPQLAPSNPPNQYGQYQGSAANHSYVIDNIVKAMKGEAYNIATAEEAAASVRIIEEVYRLRDSQLSK